jgi:hypothetical protein
MKRGIALRLMAWNLALAAIALPPAAVRAGGLLCAIQFGDGNATEEMIAILRDRGSGGLQQALDAHDRLQNEQQKLQTELDQLTAVAYDGNKEQIIKLEANIAESNRQIERMTAVIDQIGGQRSCSVSRLYWYTDLEQAQAEAARTGRPILSLRMLGKLTDEYSCANSRFFRTALYSNKQISDYLRDNYVLHWQSVRPVPRVTIDFGDGRKLERTLTGNSAHYILTSSGEPLDVLPGLYAPKAFHDWLTRSQTLHNEYLAADESTRPDTLKQYHQERRRGVYASWLHDVQKLGGNHVMDVERRINDAVTLANRLKTESPLAVAASRMSESKTAAEAPLLRFASFSGPWIEHGMDDELWNAIATFHRDDVQLDEPSIKLIRREFPLAGAAGRLAVSKSVQEDPVLRMVRSFEDSMNLDTVRNEYLLHRRIHEVFADGEPVTANFDGLNEWVYAELFLTPSSDPWLGLAPRDVYTALEGDGRTEPTAKVARSAGGQ